MAPLSLMSSVKKLPIYFVFVVVAGDDDLEIEVIGRSGRSRMGRSTR